MAEVPASTGVTIRFSAKLFCLFISLSLGRNSLMVFAQSAGAVEYTASLQRGKTPHRNERHGYDTKQSDREVPVMLELWRMRSAPLLPSLQGPLWPGVVEPDKVPIYGLNRTFHDVTVFLRIYAKLKCLK